MASKKDGGMAFVVKRSAALAALQRSHKVVERRITIPILGNVVLSAKGKELTIKATDLDVEIVDRVETQVVVPGATTIPAHMFYDIVRKLPEGADITCAAGETMSIQSGKSKFMLHMLSDADFPDLQFGEGKSEFDIKASDLARLIDRTQFAISTEETRYYLNGIYFHPFKSGNHNKLRAAATDGHRLARAEIEMPSGGEQMPAIIIPRKTVGIMMALLGESEEMVRLEVSDAKIRLTVGTTTLTSKLIDGTFPDYERVIPSNNEKKMTFDVDAMKRAIDRTKTIGGTGGVRLSLSKGTLGLQVKNMQDGSVAEDEIDFEYDGEDMQIGFNPAYMLELLDQMNPKLPGVSEMNDPGSPTIFRNAEDTVYVLMPMRV